MQKFQRTIQHSKSISGIALHSGEKCHLTVKPAKQGGIVFSRIDLNPSVNVKASYLHREVSQYHTSLIKDGVKIATVEHFLSALAALQIDNLLVELDSKELPILDGCSTEWIAFLENCKIKELPNQKIFFQVKEEVKVGDDNYYASFCPSNKIRYQFFIDFAHPIIQQQHYCFDLELANYKKEIAPCRTFGFEKDIERMKQKGLIQGGSLENAIVLSNDGKLLNKQKLVFADEFVRHKILDAIGDIYLSGVNIIGEYYGHKASHRLNVALLEKLFSSQTNHNF